MNDDAPLRRLLERIADVTVVGLLTTAGSLPLVTGTAALTAAAVTLKTTDSGSLWARYWEAFRRYLRPTVPTQLGLLVTQVVGLVDLFVAIHWRAHGASIPVAAPAMAIGALLTLSAVVLPPYLANLVLVGNGRTASLRAATTEACGRPLTSVIVAALGVTLVLVGVSLPLAIPLLAGIWAIAPVTLIRRGQRRAGPQPAESLRSSTS